MQELSLHCPLGEKCPHPPWSPCHSRLSWGYHSKGLNLFKEVTTPFSGALQQVQKRAPSSCGHYNEILQRLRANRGCKNKASPRRAGHLKVTGISNSLLAVTAGTLDHLSRWKCKPPAQGSSFPVWEVVRTAP